MRKCYFIVPENDIYYSQNQGISKGNMSYEGGKQESYVRRRDEMAYSFSLPKKGKIYYFAIYRHKFTK
jgi:hypothetical protein